MKPFHVKKFIQWGLTVFMTLLLAACGGDNNDSNSDSSGNIVTTANSTMPANAFAATLIGSQEVPPTLSTAIGTGAVVVDPVTRIMKASINTAGIFGIAAHIHEAAPGVAGPIIFPLTEPAPGSGIWTTQVTLTEAQFNTLKAGNYYFNVHSTAFPNGEIRGQILHQLPQSGGTSATTPITFINVLNGAQQIPATLSAATAIGIALVDPVAKTLSTSIASAGIAGNAASIRAGTAGINGPIVFSLIETAAGSGIWIAKVALTDAQIGAITSGGYYFEVRSVAFPEGEIRGQITQTTTGVATTGAGTTGTGSTGTGLTGFGLTGTGITGTGITGTGIIGMGTTGTDTTGIGTIGTGAIGTGTTGIGTIGTGAIGTGTTGIGTIGTGAIGTGTTGIGTIGTGAIGTGTTGIGTTGTGAIGTGTPGVGTIGTGAIGTGTPGVGTIGTGAIGTGTTGIGTIGTGVIGTGTTGIGTTGTGAISTPGIGTTGIGTIGTGIGTTTTGAALSGGI
jgi:hypothetical protein